MTHNEKPMYFILGCFLGFFLGWLTFPIAFLFVMGALP